MFISIFVCDNSSNNNHKVIVVFRKKPFLFSIDKISNFDLFYKTGSERQRSLSEKVSENLTQHDLTLKNPSIRLFIPTPPGSPHRTSYFMVFDKTIFDKVSVSPFYNYNS